MWLAEWFFINANTIIGKAIPRNSFSRNAFQRCLVYKSILRNTIFFFSKIPSTKCCRSWSAMIQWRPTAVCSGPGVDRRWLGNYTGGPTEAQRWFGSSPMAVGGGLTIVMFFQGLRSKGILVFLFSETFPFHGNPTFSWERVETFFILGSITCPIIFFQTTNQTWECYIPKLRVLGMYKYSANHTPLMLTRQLLCSLWFLDKWGLSSPILTLSFF